MTASGTATDPVCGMTVDPERAAATHEHAGETFYFCAVACRDRFARDPARFLAPPDARSAPEAAAPGEPARATYTCPMHPEVRQPGPGACPDCGMALEPLAPSLVDPAEDPELVDMSRRFRVAAVFTLPVFALAMGRHAAPGAFAALSPAADHALQLALTLPVVTWCAWPLLARGWTSLATLRLNMFTLIALGVVAGFAYSAMAVAAPGLFPAGFRGHDGSVGVYFEPAAVIVTLVLLGQVLELRARGRTDSALRALLELAPPTARRVASARLEEGVPVDVIAVGDRLRVSPVE